MGIYYYNGYTVSTLDTQIHFFYSNSNDTLLHYTKHISAIIKIQKWWKRLKFIKL